MEESKLKDYTYNGSFQLRSGNTILGEIRYAENISKHYKIYRITDFIRILHLSSNFTLKVGSRHRFPGTRHCWAPWLTIRSALEQYSYNSTVIADIVRRKALEEEPTPIKFEKRNKLIDFLLQLPNEKLIKALQSFHTALEDFGTWIKQSGGNPNDFMFKDTEEFSALDFVDLLHSYNFRIVSDSEEKRPEQVNTPAVKVQTIEGKNLQIVLNIKLS